MILGGKMDGKNLKKYCLFLVIIIATGFCIESLSKRIKTKLETRHKIAQSNINNLDTGININTEENISAKKSKLLTGRETWINIFVHGIISLTPVLSFKTMNHVKQDDLDNTVYIEYVKNARSNSFFCKNEPKQAVGLQKIEKDEIDRNSSCSTIAKLFDLQFQDSNNYYYTFGWSGLMSNKKRYQDAKNFYNQYSKEIQSFRDKGIYPKTRLICFSHGGSIGLEIGEVIKKENLPLLFNIDELILLGTPILDETRRFVNEPVFKKIYNFYSGSDRVQILDFSQENKHFSRRKFKAVKDFQPNNNLLQIKLEIFRPVKPKNGEIAKDVQWNLCPPRHSVGIRKASPGHCEWWFLKYTNNFYRDTFPFEPLPVVAFIPTIINNLNNSKFEPNKTKIFGNMINVKIRPFEHSMIIESGKTKTKLDFLSKEEFNLFKDIVYKLNIEKICKNRYSQEVNAVLNKAKSTIEEYNKNKEIVKRQEKKLSK